MNDAIPALPTALAARQSRRDALRTYAPPALAVVGATSLNKNSFGLSGNLKSNSGRGNGPEGDPDPDPGNSGGHNQGGDGDPNPGGKKK